MYMKWKDDVIKMVMWTYDQMFSWHLTEETLTKMDGKAHLITKETYMIQMKIFEIKWSK